MGRITGTRRDDTINGTAGDDSIQAGRGDDIVKGAEGNDTLRGGFGDDTIRGGVGDDLMSGAEGDDVFVFARGDGSDTISGFELGSDRIGLRGFNFDSDDLLDLVSIEDGNVVIDFGGANPGDRIVLKDIDLSNFNPLDLFD